MKNLLLVLSASVAWTVVADEAAVEAKLKNDIMTIVDQVNPIDPATSQRKYISFGFISDIHKCKRVPGDDAATDPVKDYWYSTGGCLTEAEPTIRLLGAVASEAGIDAVINGGDLSTAPIIKGGFTVPEYTNEIWNVKKMFDRYVKVPFFTVSGNHDRAYTEGSANFGLSDAEWAYVLTNFNSSAATANAHGVDVIYHRDLAKAKIGADAYGRYEGNTFDLDFRRLYATKGYNVRICCLDQFDTCTGSEAKYRAADSANFYDRDSGDRLDPEKTNENTIMGLVDHGHGNAPYSDANNLMHTFMNGTHQGRGFFGLVCAHAHFTEDTKLLEDVWDKLANPGNEVYASMIRVASAFAVNCPSKPSSHDLGTEGAYHFSLFVIDPDKKLFREIRVGGWRGVGASYAAENPVVQLHDFNIRTHLGQGGEEEDPTEDPQDPVDPAKLYSEYRDASGLPQSVTLSYFDGPTTRGFAWQTAKTVAEGTVWLRKGDYSASADIVGKSGTVVIPATADVNSFCTTYKAVASDLSAGLWSYCLGTADKSVCGKFTVRAEEDGPVVAVNVNDIETKAPEGILRWQQTVSAAAKVLPADFDLVLSGGDFFHGGMSVSNCNDYVEWGVTVDSARAKFGDAVWIMALGNHDTVLGSKIVCENYRYTEKDHFGGHVFEQGGVQFLTLPFYVNEDAVPDGVTNWLVSALSAPTDARWRIVMTHASPYTTGSHAASKYFIKQLTPIFAQYKVDLVLQGHDHTYSRTLPYRWSGAGYTQMTSDSVNVNLEPATTNVQGYVGVPFYHHPEGTFYVCAGASGSDIGKKAAYADRDGEYSYSKREFKVVTDTVKLDSKYAAAGADGSKELNMPMFGVLKIDGDLLTYDWYVTETDGSATLFDTLRVCKAGETFALVCKEKLTDETTFTIGVTLTDDGTGSATLGSLAGLTDKSSLFIFGIASAAK